MKPPPWTSNSTKALQIAEYARENGHSSVFHDATNKAYWENGKDIGKMSVLREIIEEAGMNWSEIEKFLKDQRYWPKVMEQYQEAQDLGFTGIPAFVIGEFGFTGAQPLEIFRMVLQKASDAIGTDNDKPMWGQVIK